MADGEFSSTWSWQPNYQVRVTDLDRTLRTALPAVKRGLQAARTSLRGFLRMFPAMFKVEGGLVKAVNLPAAPAPAAPAAPRPETAEERRARMDREYRESQRLREEQDRAREAARAERQRARLASLRAAYPERSR